jgi:hypothetical protein
MWNYKHLSCIVAVVAVVAFRAAPAGAETIYTDFPTWSAKFPGATEVTIPLPSPAPNTAYNYLGTASASVTYSKVLFSQQATYGAFNQFFNVGPLFSGQPAVLSSQSVLGGVPDILITFPTPVQGFALNFGTENGKSVTFTLSDNYSYTVPSTVSSIYQTPNFSGAGAASSITWVQITSQDPVLNVNNIYYLAAVPEPVGIVSLVGIGGMGLAALAFRRRRAA